MIFQFSFEMFTQFYVLHSIIHVENLIETINLGLSSLFLQQQKFPITWYLICAEATKRKSTDSSRVHAVITVMQNNKTADLETIQKNRQCF